MNLIQCFQKNSTWYKGARRNGTPVGILWHDTAGGNPYIKRYVQPFETDANCAEMLSLLGKNQYKNDWNHIEHEAGLNAWIGKLADGTVATVQAGEFDIHAWGCGGGDAGSCNGYIKNGTKSQWVNPFWIQFEICDDKYTDEAYFKAVYKEACEFTAYICKKFGIDPKGTVDFNGVTVPTILCHADSYKLKLGGNHGDVYGWFNKYGKTMDSVRNDVAALLKAEAPDTEEAEPEYKFQNLDVVKLKAGVNTYSSGTKMASFVLKSTLYVRGYRGSKEVVISTLKEGAVTGVVFATDLELVSKDEPKTQKPEEQTKTEPEASTAEAEPKTNKPEQPTAEDEPKPDAEQTSENLADDTKESKPEEEPTPEETAPESPEIVSDVNSENENEYIGTPEEAQNFAVRLLNVIIKFILKVFGKK